MPVALRVIGVGPGAVRGQVAVRIIGERRHAGDPRQLVQGVGGQTALVAAAVGCAIVGAAVLVVVPAEPVSDWLTA